MELKLYHSRLYSLRRASPTFRRKFLNRLGEHPLLMLTPFLLGMSVVTGLVGLIAVRHSSTASPAVHFAGRQPPVATDFGNEATLPATSVAHVSQKTL